MVMDATPATARTIRPIRITYFRRSDKVSGAD
jgi:hypothetical protein